MTEDSSASSLTPVEDPSKSTEKQPVLTRWRLGALRFLSNDREQEWREILEESNEGEDISEHERSLISAALQLDTVIIDAVAVPRSDIIALPIDASFGEVLQTFQTSRKSRLLVMGENLDDIRGFIALKDIVGFVGRDDTFDMKEVLRPATFLPETMTGDKALQVMKKDRVQVCVVVDEYGGTGGLLTLKDILEELVGDIEDEDDFTAPVPPRQLQKGIYKIDPKMSVEDFRTFFKLPEPLGEDDFETVSGYILNLLGRLPKQGEKLPERDGVSLIVTTTDGRRILGVEAHAKSAE